ncbi:MAG: hypothetical protein AAGA54_35770 [Myxococcota bacterium]
MWGAIAQPMGAIGGVIKTIGERALHQSEAMEPAPEQAVAAAASASAHKIMLRAADTEFIKYTWWMRAIRWQGETLGVGAGLAPELRTELRAWAARVGVPVKGRR